MCKITRASGCAILFLAAIGCGSSATQDQPSSPDRKSARKPVQPSSPSGISEKKTAVEKTAGKKQNPASKPDATKDKKDKINLAGENDQPPQAKTSDPPVAENGAKTDRYGDPLPPAAVARLGTIRYRSAGAPQAVSADGTKYATTSGKTIDVLDVASGKKLHEVHHDTNDIFWRWRGLAFNPRGDSLLAVSLDGLYRLDLTTGKFGKLEIEFPVKPRQLLMSADGKRLALLEEANIVGAEGTIHICDVASGETVRTFDKFKNRLSWMELSVGGQVFGMALGDEEARKTTVQVWNTDSGKLLFQRELSWDVIDRLPLDLTPAGTHLALPLDKENMSIVDLSDTQQVAQFKRPFISQIFLSPDAKLAVVGFSTSFYVVDVISGKQLVGLPPQGGFGGTVRFMPDSKTLLLSNEKTANLVDAATGQPRTTFEAHTRVVRIVSFSADAQRIATLGNDGEIRAWDISKQLAIWRLPPPSGVPGANGVAISPDGKYAACVSWGEFLTIADLDAGTILKDLRGEQIGFLSDNSTSQGILAFSPDGKRLAFSESIERKTRLVSVLDLATEEKISVIFGSRINHIEWFPDGKRLAACGEDPAIHVYDAVDLKPLHSIPCDEKQNVLDFTIARDGKSLAAIIDSRSGGGAVAFRQAETGAPLMDFQPEGITDDRRRYGQVVFSPNGALFAAITEYAKNRRDGTCYVWNRQTGKLVAQLGSPEEPVHWIAFSADGKQLATAQWDTTTVVWDVASLPAPSSGETEN